MDELAAMDNVDRYELLEQTASVREAVSKVHVDAGFRDLYSDPIIISFVSCRLLSSILPLMLSQHGATFASSTNSKSD